MKRIILLFALLISTVSFAQSTGFNYKALVVNSGTPVANQLISVKIKLKHGTSVKWYEQHNNVQTDANGIFSLSIGNGTRTGGTYTTFSQINWELYSNMKLTVEVNTGSGFHTLVDDVAFGSVPYTKQALKANEASEAKKLAASNTSRIYLNSGGANGGIYFKYHPTGTDAGNFNIYQYNHLLYFNSSYADGTFRFLKKIEMRNNAKITATGSGDADLKAYAYGFVQNSGSITAEISTDNFTITKITNGKYKVTLSDLSTSSTLSPYIVVATPEAGFSRYRLTASVDYITSGASEGKSFYVRIYDTSGSMVDNSFHFIVYKK